VRKVDGLAYKTNRRAKREERKKEKFDVMPYGDNASFAKLFKGNYSVLKMLSSVGFNFFFYMVEFLLTSNHYFIYVDVDKVAKEMGYKTRKSVYDALIELLNYDILRKKTGEGFFWVNPNVVFRGDRTYVLNKNIEGFENVESQMFTNDLSLQDQLDLEATFEWSTLELLRKHHNDVTAATVGSNHCAWRKGKSSLGKPTDDWGIFIQRQLKRMSDLVGANIKFVEPTEWSESLTVDVNGTIVGLVHGHQAASGQFSNWWAKQVHGGAPLAHADIAISGHYHHLSIQPSGRTPFTGRSKWHLQAPTLDNGSSWYANSIRWIIYGKLLCVCISSCLSLCIGCAFCCIGRHCTSN